VLAQPRYREAARRCAVLLEEAPGPAGAARLIEDLAPEQAGAAAIHGRIEGILS
jgi:UDP:flavonoid glycosyltransferase YjiC (YdhE family)